MPKRANRTEKLTVPLTRLELAKVAKMARELDVSRPQVVRIALREHYSRLQSADNSDNSDISADQSADQPVPAA